MLELFGDFDDLDFTQAQTCPVCGEVILKAYPGMIHILQASLESKVCFRNLFGYDPSDDIERIKEQRKQRKQKEPTHQPRGI